MKIKKVDTSPFQNQKPGTSGLRKKTREFMKTNYVENYIQAVFNCMKIKDKSFVLGGDGRYYNSVVINKIIAMAVANEAKLIYVVKEGIISTPAISNFITKYLLDFGLMLSASHNPGGIDADFGIKINVKNGGPSGVDLTDKIYNETLEINSYFTIDNLSIDLSKEKRFKILNTDIIVVDGVNDYANKMEEIFDFSAIKNLLKQNNFKISFNGLFGASGIFAKEIFNKRLGVPNDSLVNCCSKEDFGGLHPDPNPVTIKDFTNYVRNDNSIILGFACDADGDRSMLFSHKHNLEPSDSLAIIVHNFTLVSYYKDKMKGVARSRATSRAVDLVAKKIGVDLYCVPTGWKFFSTLLENNKVTFCGEESFGMSSNHILEKDGIWTILFFLHIMSKTNKTFDNLIEELWKEYGRVYYLRHDLEQLTTETFNKLFNNLKYNCSRFNDKNINSKYKILDFYDFSYTDVITHDVFDQQGFVVIFNNNAEVMFRVSGTGTSGVTIRIYISQHEENQSQIFLNKHSYLAELVKVIYDLFEYNINPTTII